MPRNAARLTAEKVRTAGPGKYGDGDCLYLYVRSATARYWVLRYTPRGGTTRYMGLGRAGYYEGAVTLDEARDKAGALYKLFRAGVDPLARRDVIAASEAAQADIAAIKLMTFRVAAENYVASRAHEWSNPRHRTQWRSTLDAYAYPHMGDLVVGDVETGHVMAALEPIWRTQPETATRLREMIETVLDFATALEWRRGENPARWRGDLCSILARQSKTGW